MVAIQRFECDLHSILVITWDFSLYYLEDSSESGTCISWSQFFWFDWISWLSCRLVDDQLSHPSELKRGQTRQNEKNYFLAFTPVVIIPCRLTVLTMSSPEVRCMGVHLCTAFLQQYHAQTNNPEIESLTMDVKRLLDWYDSLTPDLIETIFSSESFLRACMGYEGFWSSVINVDE